MHQSLLDPKILRLVITSEIGKSSLSAVARTCKTFSEIALDVLWEELDSVVPLLLLFGPLHQHDHVSVTNSNGWGPTYNTLSKVRSINFRIISRY